MQNIASLKNQISQKCNFSEKADAVQKHLLQNSSSFLDVFILNSSSEKITVPESNCRKELPIFKKWLLCRSFTPKKKLFWKNNSCEKVTVVKKEKKAAVLKKYLHRKNNRCVKVVTLKKSTKKDTTKDKNINICSLN